jgi:hypothetical protein
MMKKESSNLKPRIAMEKAVQARLQNTALTIKLIYVAIVQKRCMN